MRKYNLLKEDQPVESIALPQINVRQPQMGLINPIARGPFEPLMKNRFYISFPENTRIPSHLVKSGFLLKYSYNNGRIEWDDMKISFYNPIEPSIQQIFVDMMRNDSIQNIMNMTIKMLDPTGRVVSEWSVNGFISGVNFGEFDYSSDSPLELSINIVVNHATLMY